MRCSNCGKEIPFTGKVCPYCKTDKSQDQVSHAFGFVGGMIGALVMYYAAGFGWAIVGLVVGVIAGMVIASAMRKSREENN